MEYNVTFKNIYISGCWWLMPAILVAWELRSRGSWFKATTGE